MKYNAIAYSDDFHDGRVSGTIRIVGDTLIFEGDDLTWHFYKNQIEVDHGGTAGRQIFIRSTTDHYKISTTDVGFLKNPFFESSSQVSHKSSDIIRQRRKCDPLAIRRPFRRMRRGAE